MASKTLPEWQPDRLHLQHWLVQQTLGYVLHPAVLIDKPDLQVVDIGCGNGAWLIELSHIVPSTTQLYGFDLTPVNFPAKAFLPPNVHLQVMDVLADLPNDTAGAFDVVHVRMFSSIITHNNVQPLMSNLVKMLKPGGYLQWEEMDRSKMRAIAPHPSASVSGCENFLKIFNAFSTQVGNLTGWMEELPATLQAHHVSVVYHAWVDKKPEYYKAWMEDWLLVYEDVGHNFPHAEDAPGSQYTREWFQGLLSKVVDEADQGVVLDMQKLMVVVGQKRGSE